ncbi:MAG: phosphoribosylaminoimidazolesuccinocarboxamide synthase [Planctomycetota bacterium]|nr:phosphoribosylaminoimidazolesuccinocarboxamide synthase [Planctomycetota bacterium]
MDNNEGLTHLRSGKVREIYEIEGHMLIVATDRISAYDWVLEDEIPGKGRLLTEISAFWFDRLAHIVPNHLITTDINVMPDAVQANRDYFAGRSMLVMPAEVVPIECIVRGYITGSGWREYKKLGTVCGIELPEGLEESQRLEDPLFTPSTKADEGHDENISFEKACEIAGKEVMETLREISLQLYTTARDHALLRGVIIADTKFEFGLNPDGELMLIDEALTPDSSRFWPAEDYEPGRSQPSFDKQYVRDYLTGTDWDRESPPPPLPEEVIARTVEKYEQAKALLTT